ncbi:glucuronidase 3 [Striga asiatica]|uniref:Glucuronidase 3 n=1 Tax=Striga asiatica TaxID=4170 RepID=A0A5A7PWQ6_STRAF|nr:glucuronidase 3 [Striga asiatica]
MVSLNEWLVFSSVVTVIYLSFACGAESISVTEQGRIAETDGNFICVTLDMWPPAKCDYGVCSWGNASLLTVDLDNPILISAVKGNELGGVPVEGVRVEPEQYAADMARLEEVVKSIYVGPNINTPALIAPGRVFEYEWFKKFITNETRPPGVITHHTYPLGSGYDENLKNKILNATVLDEAAEVFKQMHNLLKLSPTKTVSWIGESGGVYNSGRDGITNTFLFSFWYLDHMATAAVYDTKVYCRQTLTGGNYALLDTATFIPNPDYYSALLWHRLMGTQVLMTSYNGTKDLRAYAHCAKQSDGLTLLLINLSPDTIIKTNVFSLVPNLVREYREEYHLSPMDRKLQSRTVLLNGKPLFVGPSGAIPSLKPKQVANSKPITVNPYTIAFVHFPHFLIPACQSSCVRDICKMVEWRALSSLVIVGCLSFGFGCNGIRVSEEGTVSIGSEKPIAETDDRFICMTIDLWPPSKCDYGVCSWGEASLLTVDLDNPILNNAVKAAFSPLRIRMGGSLQDRLTYKTPSNPSPSCPHFTFNTSYLYNFTEGCLSLDRWDQVNSFLNRTGAIAIFGLNALHGKVVLPHPGPLGPFNTTDAIGSWDPTISEELIRYTHEEKGNELGGLPVLGVEVTPEQYAADMARLEEVLKSIYVGTDIPALIAPAGVYEYEWFKRYITNTTRPPGVITHHMYPIGSEAGGVFNSGRDGVTNTFLFSFWSLDHMAMAAAYDTKVYCRQTLTGGNYALLDTTTFLPNPDYYSALLWDRLMGSRVLLTSYKGSRDLRAYAHCAKKSDGIIILLINLSGSTIVKTKVDLQAYGLKEYSYRELVYREEYHLSPMDGDLQSRTVLLNGRPLFVSPSGAIPALRPKKVAGSKPITVNPNTIVFVHIPHLIIPACTVPELGGAFVRDM